MFRFLRIRQRGVERAALLLGVAALMSRFLGLLRDRIFAAEFGAGDTLDIYFAAFRIPDLIYNVLIAGAISAAFIPIFLEVHKKKESYAWRVASNFLNTMTVFLVALGALGFVIMPYLVYLIAPGFEGEKREMTIFLSRIMLLSPILLGISAIFSGVNQSFHRFIPYALAPIFYNVGIIFGVLFLVPIWGIAGLAWGVVIGALMHMAIQFPSALFVGFKFVPIFSLHLYEFGRMMRLILPRAFGLVAVQINLWVMTAIASLLSVGSIAIFHFANNLQYIPIGIVGISFAVASFPALSRSVSEKKHQEFLEMFSRVVRQILLFAIPLSVLMFVLRAHVVRVVLGTGAFGWEETRLTAALLGLFAIGITAHSIIPVIARAYYATQDTKTPVLISIGGIVINIVLSLLFVFVLLQDGVAGALSGVLDIGDLTNISLLGLPLAFSISGIVTSLVLLGVFFVRYKGAYRREIVNSSVRLSLLALIAGIVTFWSLRVILAIVPVDQETFAGIFIQGAGAGLVGMAAYVAGIFIFKYPEAQLLKKFLRIR